MKRYTKLFTLLLCFLLNRQVESLEQALWQQGEFDQVIQQIQEDLTLENLEISHRIDLLIQLANAYQALGSSKQAYHTLLQAEQLTLDSQFNAKLTINITRLAILFASLSDVALATRQEVQARSYIDKSVAILPSNVSPHTKAMVLNHLGNVFTVEAYYTKAVTTYNECITLAKQAGIEDLVVRALINMAHAHFRNNQLQLAADGLYQAWQQIDMMENNYTKAFNLISLGELAQRIQRKSPFPIYPKVDKADSFLANQEGIVEKSEEFVRTDLRLFANTILRTALSIARKLKNNRLLSYSYGYLGQLYETEQRYSESLQLTRQAIFSAQQISALEILYRWQWQLGRLLKAEGQSKLAIESYQNALKSLQPIRQELTIGYRNSAQPFRETIGPIYFELADLLLQQATNAVDKNHWLNEARNTIEHLKSAELQDYFQDECLPTPLKSNLLQQANRAQTAVFYPILLPDRTEILLSLPEGIQVFTIKMTASQLEEEINEFRFELEDRDTSRFMEYAKRLYTRLIAPLEQTLANEKIETLIIVPDGALRTIPFAALHDGKQFLVERYAIAVTPGLLLTESPTTEVKGGATLLMGGLSQAVQGFVALAHVSKETQLINQIYRQKTTILMNEQFTMKQFTSKLSENMYSMVHIASHGQFNSDPRKTFLLMYDDKLTINRLEQLIRRSDPIELLTLSACQTAVGDDQAALGLAGIALKAGARSALASLWFVEDEATTQLISEFYRQLHHHQLSKAKALQNAQKHLLSQSRYRHPALWASFLLIGNWL